MLTLFHAAKGGSGTTVITALAALVHGEPTLIVDLDDELPAALGLGDADRPGVADWLVSEAPLAHLADLLVEVDDSTELLATRRHDQGAARRGELPREPLTRWMQLASWCRTWAATRNGRVLIDAGTRVIPDEFLAACDDRLLVTRSCYLSLREASRSGIDTTGVVVIDEPGRSLAANDIEQAVRAPVIASVSWEPNIARAVDAGLLHAGRIQRSTVRALSRLLSATGHGAPVAA